MVCGAAGTAVQLGCVHKWVMEGKAFSGLPNAARGRGGRDMKVIYLGSSCQIGDLNSKISNLSEVT